MSLGGSVAAGGHWPVPVKLRQSSNCEGPVCCLITGQTSFQGPGMFIHLPRVCPSLPPSVRLSSFHSTNADWRCTVGGLVSAEIPTIRKRETAQGSKQMHMGHSIRAGSVLCALPQPRSVTWRPRNQPRREPASASQSWASGGSQHSAGHHPENGGL